MGLATSLSRRATHIICSEFHIQVEWAIFSEYKFSTWTIELKWWFFYNSNLCLQWNICPRPGRKKLFQGRTAKISASEPWEPSGASTCAVLACPPAHSVPFQDKGWAHACVWCCRWQWGVWNLPPDCFDSRAVVSVVSGNKQCIKRSASQEVKDFHYQRRKEQLTKKHFYDHPLAVLFFNLQLNLPSENIGDSTLHTKCNL